MSLRSLYEETLPKKLTSTMNHNMHMEIATFSKHVSTSDKKVSLRKKVLAPPPHCKLHDMNDRLRKAHQESWCKSKIFAEIVNNRLKTNISKSAKLQKLMDKLDKNADKSNEKDHQRPP